LKISWMVQSHWRVSHPCTLMFVSQGAGAFEVAARQHLMNVVKKTVQGVVFSIYPHISMLQFSYDSSVLLDLFMHDQVFVFIFCALC
jgi:hypothetical protein